MHNAQVFICSASVYSFEIQGKETWYQIQIIPRVEPCYTIARRYMDFMHLCTDLSKQFPQLVHKPSLNLFRSRTNKISPDEPEYQQSTGMIHRTSLPTLTKLTTSATPWRLTSSNHALRLKRQKKLDVYVYKLFLMPHQVHQCPVVLSFFNYQPPVYLYKTLPPSPSASSISTLQGNQPLPHPASVHEDDPPSLTCSSTCSSTTATTTSPTLDRRGTYVAGSSQAEPSLSPSSSSSTIAAQTAPPPSASCSSLATKYMSVSLYLGPQSYVTVTLPRDTMLLAELKHQLNHKLAEHQLDALPSPSVLAYHHIAITSREGALKTLTLNSRQPWIDCDNVMALASSHHITFFSSCTPIPPPNNSPVPDAQSHQKCIARQWKYRKDHWPDDTKEQVLLIASNKDLQAALQGRWRRLDHVTLSCLAW
ncbi:hypothetical protein DM01DRAFT_1118284 [Hesseltinella vesiculosa]|uniref:PX domain-containing protein n=1 Tax=Hesseltinella vesiculosa TaxID=101127 RepID=A0A1X2G9U3_9FUNG|nr:hypothetical protein DM01DRAFT_1118284 [Hesseltinella vesiculosa]